MFFGQLVIDISEQPKTRKFRPVLSQEPRRTPRVQQRLELLKRSNTMGSEKSYSYNARQTRLKNSNPTRQQNNNTKKKCSKQPPILTPHLRLIPGLVMTIPNDQGGRLRLRLQHRLFEAPCSNEIQIKPRIQKFFQRTR